MFKRKDRGEREKGDSHKGVHEVGTQRGQGTTRGGWGSWSCGTVAQLPPEMPPPPATPSYLSLGKNGEGEVRGELEKMID